MAEKLILFGRSALDYWRLSGGAPQVAPDELAALHARPPRARDATYRRLCDLASDLLIPFPLSLMCQDARERRNSRLARFSVWKDAEVEKDVSWVAEVLGVCELPLALAQLAAKEGLVESLLGVSEFCGTYLMAPAAGAGADPPRGLWPEHHEQPERQGAEKSRPALLHPFL